MKKENDFWYRLIFLKCNHCNHKFVVRNGFYTVATCPSCEKYVEIYDSGKNSQRIDDILLEEEKSELIDIYYYKKLESKLVR